MRYPRRSYTMVTAVAMLLVLAGSAEAQGRGRGHGHGLRIPPGHMPGPGQCRVWYPGVPPGHQPPAVPCFALRGYRFVGAVVVEGPPRGGRYAYWDEGWGGGGRFRVEFVFRSRDAWRREGVRIMAAYEREVARDRDRDVRRRGH